MGFHDDVFCAHALAHALGVKEVPLQTKMLGRDSGEYTITAEGRLMRRLFSYRWESGSDPVTPRFDRRSLGEVDTEFHGDVVLYGENQAGESVEYVARFTHGTLESLTPLAELSEARRDMLATLQGGG